MGISLDQLIKSVKKIKSYANKILDEKLNIQADFLTDSGFGNARVNEGKFQYYDKSSMTWKDSINAISEISVHVVPKVMESITMGIDLNNHCYKLKWKEPSDTVIDGQVVSVVEKVVIVRKKDSAPTSPTDGDVVITINRKQFGKHADSWYSDTTLNPIDGDVYYYKAFPYNNGELYCNSINNEFHLVYRDYEFYGFRLDQSESDPDSMITYLEGVNNAGYAPAAMNYTTSIFDYGDWSDTWFIKNCKPCMLKFDGTVDYYLDPDDYTKKENGEASDVANSAYEGNAMIEFPKVYVKIARVEDNVVDIFISSKKIDDTYHCYAHLDSNSNEMDYTYMSIYNGSSVSSKLRSLSGRACARELTIAKNISYAEANNVSDDNAIWNIETYGDRQLITILLLLMAKTTDSKTAYGNGNMYYSSGSTYSSFINTGTMDDKGLFWGSNSTSKVGVKVFGMENYWGQQNRFILGVITDAKKISKVKLYANDGESSGYNLTGDGYREVGIVSGSGFIDKTYIDSDMLGVFIPKSFKGSKSTYYNCYSSNYSSDIADLCAAVVGGSCYTGNSNKGVGIFYFGHPAISYSNWSTGAVLSCKPLKK